MTDELKPVPCGCGGEAKVEEWVGRWYVRCQKSNCLISTKNCDTEAEAITAWNRAMGERTAKVKKGAYDLMRCECGMPVSSNYEYCPKCRARLEWQ